MSLIELRPNRRLLDHQFEGYKLNLQALPHYVHNLESSVDNVHPNELQYSFVHAKLFALHNHLALDPWDYTFSYYYVDKNRQVRHVTFENTTHTFETKAVYDVPVNIERKPGHFNLCLAFPYSNLALVSDGTGYLHIIDTPARNRPAGVDQKWKTLLSTLVLGEGKYFVIVDSRVQEKDDKEVLHCLLQSVEQSEQHSSSVLSWVTYENDGLGWKQVNMRQLQGKGTVHYAVIETSCAALYVASDHPFKFILDTGNEIKKPTKDEEQKQIIYTWLQTSEDLSITLQLQEKFDKSLLHVTVTPINIKVSYAGKIFIDGKFKHKVDSELTTWNIQESGQVDILVTKSESMIWDQLIEGGDRNGEQIMDASLVEETHRRLAHLCSETDVTNDQSVPGFSTQELEECDAASEEDTVLVRLETENHMTTHRIPLSVNQYLFNINIETQEVPALVLRHDVDACVWQPYAKLINSETWPVKHLGTLFAFGYVQSSKQNRKFVTCPPNFSYSVVCEATRHIFVYQHSGSPDSQLRKRSEGSIKPVKVGQQHVFNIDKYGEVLGINATNEFLFILTESSIISIEVR